MHGKVPSLGESSTHESGDRPETVSAARVERGRDARRPSPVPHFPLPVASRSSLIARGARGRLQLMTILTLRSLAGFCALLGLMIITRAGHLGTAWTPPDATWPVLYLAGFYFTRQWR